MKILITKIEFEFTDASTLGGKDFIISGKMVHYVIHNNNNEISGKKWFPGTEHDRVLELDFIEKQIETDIQVILGENGS